MADNEKKYFKILGVRDDEIVLLSKVNDCTCNGEKSGQLHAITMRPLTREQIEYSWSEENLIDYWKDAVACDRTEDGLYDYIETLKSYEDTDLPFMDDYSFRYETNSALDKLSQRERDKIIKILSESCEEVGDTMVNIECSSMIHIDNEILGNADGFMDSFQYVTDEFLKIYPTLIAFSKGDISYNTCIKELDN